MELDKKAPWAIDGKYREITSIHHLAGAAGRAIPTSRSRHPLRAHLYSYIANDPPTTRGKNYHCLRVINAT